MPIRYVAERQYGIRLEDGRMVCVFAVSAEAALDKARKSYSSEPDVIEFEGKLEHWRWI